MFWYYFPPVGWFSDLIILLIIAVCLYQRFPKSGKLFIFAISAIIVLSAIMNVIAPVTPDDGQALAADNTSPISADPEEISRGLARLDANADSIASLPSFAALQNKLAESIPGIELEPTIYDEQWRGDSLRIIVQYRINNTEKWGFVSAEGYKDKSGITISNYNMEEHK